MEKTTKKNSVTELNLVLVDPAIPATKKQLAKIARGYKKLGLLNVDATILSQTVGAFLNCNVDPANSSSSFLARRLKAHAALFVGGPVPAPAPVVEIPVVVVQPVETPKVVKTVKAKKAKTPAMPKKSPAQTAASKE